VLQDPSKPNMIQCYDPSTLEWLGQVKAMTPNEVHEVCVAASKAQKQWQLTTYTERRTVLRTIQRYICTHVTEICQVSARDSGKSMVDACLGEVLVTNEKIRTICALGQEWLQPSHRPTGPMFMHKSARVEYVPLGVIAAIAPWNYPYVNPSFERCELQLLNSLKFRSCVQLSQLHESHYFRHLCRQRCRW
jgi:acyl-CoA reductase-like NAD-dependent aldehyde dehydrogenase